jgi:hypothetical protein
MADDEVLDGTDAGLIFAENELLAALEAAMRPATGDGPADAFTVADLCRRTGRTDRAIRLALTALKERGLLDVLKVPRAGLDDRMVRTPAYRLRPQAVRPNEGRHG